MADFPDGPEFISAEWMGELLGAPVDSVAVAGSHEGTTGRAQLLLTGTGVPESIFVKYPPGDEMQRAFVTSAGMGKREVLFYRQLANEVPVRTPGVLFADSDDAGEHYLMLIEDLATSGCTFNNAAMHQGAYEETMLAEFAALHARYWRSERFDRDLAWLEPPRQHPLAVTLVQQALSQHGADLPPVFTELAELYLAHTDAIHALWNRGDHTLVHGDVHDGNLFMDGERPGFLDWALVARAPAMRDVGYFLMANLAPSEIQQRLPSLLTHYRHSLLALGVQAPPYEELLEQLRWHALYLWVGTAVTFAMGDAWQAGDYVRATLDRLHQNLAMENVGAAVKAAL